MPSRPPPTAAARGARWDVAVVVPARDEAALLPRCLASVAGAAARVAPPSRVHVVVVADRCSDATEVVAAAALANAPPRAVARAKLCMHISPHLAPAHSGAQRPERQTPDRLIYVNCAAAQQLQDAAWTRRVAILAWTRRGPQI